MAQTAPSSGNSRLEPRCKSIYTCSNQYRLCSTHVESPHLHHTRHSSTSSQERLHAATSTAQSSAARIRHMRAKPDIANRSANAGFQQCSLHPQTHTHPTARHECQWSSHAIAHFLCRDRLDAALACLSSQPLSRSRPSRSSPCCCCFAPPRGPPPLNAPCSAPASSRWIPPGPPPAPPAARLLLLAPMTLAWPPPEPLVSSCGACACAAAAAASPPLPSLAPSRLAMLSRTGGRSAAAAAAAAGLPLLRERLAGGAAGERSLLRSLLLLLLRLLLRLLPPAAHGNGKGIGQGHSARVNREVRWT